MFQSYIPHLKLLGRGKVRDIYEADDQHLLIVATDRLSAYDVIMPNPIPGKGEILTSLSNFWFDMMSDLVPNHLTKLNINSYISDKREIKILEKRSIIVKKLKPLPIESVVRGYLIGSGWRDYEKNSAICGIKLPKNLNQAQKLPEIIYTPATKAAAGDHDINIDYEMTESLIGKELAKRVKKISIDIYKRAFDYAISRGIIIADTKFEFGYVEDLDGNQQLIYIDEVGTPDSSRIWDGAAYRDGKIIENSKEGFRQLLISTVPESDVLLNKDRMDEREQLAKDFILPESVMLEVSNTYVGIASKIIGKEIVIPEDPRQEVINILDTDYGLIVK